MRFTIERIRMLVAVAAVLVLAAMAIFLAAAKWRNRLGHNDLPQRLAKEVQQQVHGFDFVHAFGAHSQYKIHASQELQLRDNRVLLHGVQIELYGQDGGSVDRISGDTFEYDPKSGLAFAVGPVEMVLTQPASPTLPDGMTGKLPAMAAPKQIHVKTSGVTFDRDTGLVTTMQRVDFALTQGSGSSMGAAYDSQKGYLTLEQAVELTAQQGADAVKIRAQHAELDRGAQTCWLRSATAEIRGTRAAAAHAEIFFRQDGSAARLIASDGFTLTTANGGQLAAPTASMDLDEHSQPRHGRLEGSVTLDSANEGRTVHGTSPTAELEFAAQGRLRHAHLERGVEFTSLEGEEQGNKGTAEQKSGDREIGNMHQGSEVQESVEGGELRVTRTWRSPVADLDFRDAGKGRVEPASLHGADGVVITGASQRGNAPKVSSKMSAAMVTGTFGPNSMLRSMSGAGHAAIEETTATGTLQTASGDRLQASFVPLGAPQNRDQGTNGPSKLENKGQRQQGNTGISGANRSGAGAVDLQSAELDGHVVLLEQPATKLSGKAQPPFRATAGRAVYEGAGEWVHLTQSPRLTDGALEVTADKVDVSRQSGDAFAHGNVKATWIGGAPGGAGPGRQPAAGANASQSAGALGGNGPAHVISADAQLNESTGEAAFRGHARLWQQANSVTAPVIVLNQHLETLTARTADAAAPVSAVLMSAGGPPGMSAAQPSGNGTGANPAGKTPATSMVRVRSGDLWYSSAEHRAVMRAGVVGVVVAGTATGTSSSDQLDLRLMPVEGSGSQAQVDRLTATGHVVLDSQGRRGTGEQLVYSSATGDYVLTGTPAAEPRMNDPAEGSVTGEALIFRSRDDSVSIEGGGRETITETTAPEAHGK